jgi:N-acetylglucosaminyl-diphospho-decaprenol L-rhamnosyltransferase
VVVVDNDSAGESLAGLHEAFAAEPRVSIVATGSNLGYAGGNNFGVRWRLEQGPVDYVLISNNDVRLPDRSTVRMLVDFAMAHPDLGGVGPRVVTPNGFPQGPYRRPSPLLRTLRNLLPVFPLAYRFWRRYTRLDRPARCYAVVGAFVLLKAEPFARAGMFDERTFLGAEEYIVAERMRAVGLNFYYYPSTTVVHDHGRSAIKRSGGEARHSDRGLASMVYYFQSYQHANPAALWMFRSSALLYNRLLLPFRQRFTI